MNVLAAELNKSVDPLSCVLPTLIQFHRAHSDRQADLASLASTTLAAQINLHKSILDSLLAAQTALDNGDYETGRVPVRSLVEEPWKAILQPSTYTLGQSSSDLLGVTANAMSERLSTLMSGLRQAPSGTAE